MLSHWKTWYDINFALNCSLTWKVCRSRDIWDSFCQQLNKHTHAGILSNASHRKGWITSVTFAAKMLCMCLCFGNIRKQKLVSAPSHGKGQPLLRTLTLQAYLMICLDSWDVSSHAEKLGATKNADGSEMMLEFLMIFNRNTSYLLSYVEHECRIEILLL